MPDTMVRADAPGTLRRPRPPCAAWLLVVAAVLATTPGLHSSPVSPAAAAAVVESLARDVNASADPCEDFFQFACGGYVASTDILPHLDSVSVVAQMEDRLREQLDGLLAEPASEQEPAAFRKAKTLYQSCVNTSLLEELGLQPARKILSALGGWPLLEGDTWDGTKFDWRQLTYKLVDMGIYGDYLFGFGVDRDISDTTKYSIEIGMPDLILDVKALDKAAAAATLEKYINDMATAARLLLESSGADSVGLFRRLGMAAAMADVAIFETDLNARMRSLEDRRNLTLSVNHMNVSALQARYPYVPWREYIRRVLPPAANITEAEPLNVADPEFMDALGALLDATPKRTLANYLVWRVLETDVLPYLNAAARAVFVQGRASRSGRGGRRSDECVKLVQQSMRMATSAMYVRRYSTTEARAAVREMVQGIGEEMHRLLEAVDWMDPVTRRAAILKADMMRYNVAFPDELLNDTVLDELYERVEVHADSLLKNTMSLQREGHMRNARRFRTSVKRQDWTYISGYADIVNAFYAHGDNSLSLPAGILQGAFFQSGRPQYMNYGGIGFVIGHEVSHGFDETGSLFNANGVMEDWWDDDTKQRFDEKVRCVVELYGRLRSEEVNATVNGVLTQSENIADNAALKLAYRAYRRHAAGHGPEAAVELPRSPPPAAPAASPDLGGPPQQPQPLVLEPGQMFWVSFASVWCSKESHREMNRKLRTSSHLPGVHRVNGAVRNQEAFAADFNCPIGSPMNPVHKCQVW